MSKPNINIPAEFAVNGIKTDFDNSKLLDGFDRLNPDVLAGDNLNKFIDDTYKGLNGVLELYEGCVLYDSTVTYTNKSLVFDITNDGIKFYHSLQNGNINNPLTDTDYWEEVNLGGSSRNIGEIVASTIPLTDAGLHLLDGALISGSGSYSAFVTYIAGLYNSGDYTAIFDTEANWQTAVTTYGVCGKFVYNSTNNTVRLPKITGITEGTIDSTTLGDLTEAGLPNITGTASGTEFPGGMIGTGAFANSGTASSTKSAATGSGSSKILNINASLSNSIYGNSTTVQPQTIKVLYYIVIATSTKTDIQVDIDEIATDLNGKADVDLSNINASASAKNTIIGWGMPDYANGISLVSLTTYTCPSDGYAVFTSSGSANFYRNIFLNGTAIGGYGRNSNYAYTCSFPVSKNDIITSANALYDGAYFYPMKGAS